MLACVPLVFGCPFRTLLSVVFAACCHSSGSVQTARYSPGDSEGTLGMTSLRLPISNEPHGTGRQSERLFVSGATSSCTTGGDGPGERLWAEIEHMNAAHASSGSDPFRWIGGGLALHCNIDLVERKVSDVASVATTYRGYESLLPDRTLKDAG